MAEGTKSDKWEPPSRGKMAQIYNDRDDLRLTVKHLRERCQSLGQACLDGELGLKDVGEILIDLGEGER